MLSAPKTQQFLPFHKSVLKEEEEEEEEAEEGENFCC